MGSFSIVPATLRGELPDTSVFFGDSTLISGFRKSNSCSSQPKSGAWSPSTYVSTARHRGIEQGVGPPEWKATTYITQVVVGIEARGVTHSRKRRRRMMITLKLIRSTT
jgi:hypothetical protein